MFLIVPLTLTTRDRSLGLQKPSLVLQISGVQSVRRNCLILWWEMFILWERIPSPRERIARFDIITEHYLVVFR